MDKRPKYIIVTGGNGAGKSSYLESLKKEKKILTLNPDTVLHKGNEDNPQEIQSPENRKYRKNKAMYLTMDRIFYKKNLAVAMVLKEPKINSLINDIKKLKQAGYQVDMAFISLDKIETHIKRIAKRTKRGGHDVPQKILKESLESILNCLKKIIPYIDKFQVLNNSLAGREPKKIFEMQKGKIIYNAGKLNEKLKECIPGLKKELAQEPRSALERLKARRQKNVMNKSLTR